MNELVEWMEEEIVKNADVGYIKQNTNESYRQVKQMNERRLRTWPTKKKTYVEIDELY